MDEIKSFFKEHKIAIIFFFVFAVVIVPVGIHFLFKWNSGVSWIQAEWTAGEALTFYGALLAAGIGAFGVFVSIQYAQKSYKEDAKNRVLPYFAVTKLQGQTTFNVFREMAREFQESQIAHQNKDGEQERRIDPPMYEETELKKACFIIDEEKIVNRSDLTVEQRDLLINAGLKREDNGGVQCLVRYPFITAPMYIENIGNGPAVCVRIGFFKADSTPLYMRPIQIKQGGTFYIHIFSTVEREKLLGNYVLSIEYQNIFKNHYMQNYSFQITEDSVSFIPDTEQVEIPSV